MPNRKQWIQTRKDVLRGIKEQVQGLLGAESEPLKGYARSYKESFVFEKWYDSSRSELQRSIENARIVIGGDFHAFAQSQRAHLRILREVKRPYILALECFEAKDQKYIDQFLGEELSECDLLLKTNWDTHWGFPWSHYRPLLYLAKENGIRVRAINKKYQSISEKTLLGRDQFSYMCLEQLTKDYPQHLLYVIYGDLHLGYDHLPFYLEAGLGLSSTDLVVVFQNSEKLYFDLVKAHKENKIDVLKTKENNYCVMVAPPWVKWQSYLMYLEKNFDRDLDEAEGLDYTEFMISLIEFAGKDLDLSFSGTDVQVYDSSYELFWEALTSDMSKKEKELASYLVQSDRSFFSPKNGQFYLARHSLNHSASLAGQYIHAQISGRQSLLWSFPDDFEALIWIEAVGFFFSKLVNHKRKAESLAQIQLELQSMHKNDGKQQALRLVLDQRLCEFIEIHAERTRERTYKPQHKSAYLTAARILGNMLGEKIYQAFHSQYWSKKVIYRFLSLKLEDKNFHSNYIKMIKDLENPSEDFGPGGGL